MPFSDRRHSPGTVARQPPARLPAPRDRCRPPTQPEVIHNLWTFAVGGGSSNSAGRRTRYAPSSPGPADRASDGSAPVLNSPNLKTGHQPSRDYTSQASPSLRYCRDFRSVTQA
jgi:hypothetical protein